MCYTRMIALKYTYGIALNCRGQAWLIHVMADLPPLNI